MGLNVLTALLFLPFCVNLLERRRTELHTENTKGFFWIKLFRFQQDLSGSGGVGPKSDLKLKHLINSKITQQEQQMGDKKRPDQDQTVIYPLGSINRNEYSCGSQLRPCVTVWDNFKQN